MKSLNVKIPLSIYQHMEGAERDNAKWVREFIESKRYLAVEDRPMREMGVFWTLKVENAIHKELKLRAIDLDITILELTARLFEQYYEV